VGLDTNNAGALIGKAENAIAGALHKVEVLVGTFIHSLGRDVKVGETVEISHADYRFLKPYEYVKDVDSDEVEADESGDTQTTTTDDEDKGDGGKAPKVEGKRKQS
jgi:hypothetical protein